MKKLLTLVFFLYCLITTSRGQTISPIRQQSLGINFTLTDFETANLIRTHSLSSVLRDKKWAKMKEMSPGLSVSYAKGVTSHIDFTAELNGSLVSCKAPATISDADADAPLISTTTGVFGNSSPGLAR